MTASRILTAGLIISTVLIACKSKKQAQASDYETYEDLTEEVTVEPYKPSYPRINDLVHTRLEVRFDFKKQYLYGKADITLKPHFYPTDSLTLDAKGMDIKSVKLRTMKNVNKPEEGLSIDSTTFSNLKYTYDSKKLRIQLGRTYTAKEQYGISIEYTAKPTELPKGGNSAIHEDIGLYFIDPLDTIPGKPTQIWTQGETEAASCWFPTIDATNQKSTEEIYITIPKKFITLSNGELIYSKDNKDDTRTDYWKQDKPHAPYLFMMAAGEFAEVKDKWRNLDVNYYVEKPYEQYARMVFGNTPEMMEFYSKKLGVDYPWAKFHQVVVRDFVSGAMENTSCVVHFDKLQHNSREHLDETYESIVAHELFHHWFGDLVTAESWANLPLNESFANYGEYLWIENKYGRTEADIHLQEYLDQYLVEAEGKQVDLVRFHYKDPGDMFDAHSYQKGGNVLHMLRKYVGDEAFFTSLNLYLTRHAYKSAEMHDLRLIVEEVTGEDLNWFFNEWFFGSGHPDILVNHSYNAADKTYNITVTKASGPSFILPVDIDINYKNKTERQRIRIEQDSQTFVFKVSEKPQWVNFDAENMIVGYVQEEKSDADWETQLKLAVLEKDKQQALTHIALFTDRAKAIELFKSSLTDASWKVRESALLKLQDLSLGEEEYGGLTNTLISMASKDPKSDVRTATTVLLFKSGNDDAKEAIKNMLKDSSYRVCGNALYALSYMDPVLAYRFADQYRYTEIESMRTPVGYAIALTSNDNELKYFEDRIKAFGSNSKYEYISIIGTHIEKAKPEIAYQGIELLQKIGVESADDITAQYIAKNTLTELADKYASIIGDIRSEQAAYKKKSANYETLEKLIMPLKDLEDRARRASDNIVL